MLCPKFGFDNECMNLISEHTYWTLEMLRIPVKVMFRCRGSIEPAPDLHATRLSTIKNSGKPDY